MTQLFEQMTIVGVGLIGGSMARKARDEGIVKKFNILMSPLRPEYKKPKGISFIQLIEDVEGITILNLHQGQKDF